MSLRGAIPLLEPPFDERLSGVVLITYYNYSDSVGYQVDYHDLR